MRLALPILWLVLVAPAWGADFFVEQTTDAPDWNPGDGLCEKAPGQACTLRASIQEANAQGSANITVPPGLYTLTIAGRSEDAAATGDLDITGDVVITGGSGLAQDTAINGGGIDRVFEILGGASATMSGITIEGGAATTATSSFGGGIVSRGDLALTACSVEGNSANTGGGIWHRDGRLTIDDCTFAANFADDFGFTNAEGGALKILSGGEAHIRDSSFWGNSAAGGPSFGGAGAAIRAEGALRVVLQNSTISGNFVSPAVGIRNTDLLLLSTTIHRSESIGLGFLSSSNNILLFGDTVVSGSGTVDCVISGAAVIRLGPSASSDTTCGFTRAGDLEGTDPLLGPLADNGGATRTHLPLPGSPLIDAGSPGCIDSSSAPLDRDQRGEDRPLDGDVAGAAFCDIGAVEFVPGALPPPLVTAANWDGEVWSIDPITGDGQMLSATAFPKLNSLAKSPTRGLLSVAQDSGAFVHIDQGNGAARQGAVLDLSPQATSVRALALSPDGVLYAMNEVSGGPLGLFTVDPATGVGTVIAATGLIFIGALDFSPGGDLFGWQINDGLIRIDPVTGVVTDVDPVEVGPLMRSIAFTPDGGLYGTSSLGISTFHRIDPVTGVATELGTSQARDLRGIVFAPEPGAGSTSAAAFAALLLIVARRRA